MSTAERSPAQQSPPPFVQLCPVCQDPLVAAPAGKVWEVVKRILEKFGASFFVKSFVQGRITDQTARSLGYPFCASCSMIFIPVQR